MADKMRALVYEGPRQMNMREIDRPDPAQGEVLIRVGETGICGSELSGYLGQNSLRQAPLVMGHEFSGTVAEVGETAAHLEIGDRVTANPLVYCGRCKYCKSGRANLCVDRKLIGAHRPGAYAEYVTVPEENVCVLPENVSFSEGALSEPLACAVHVCRLVSVSPADRMLIVGAGPIGLLILRTAIIFGLTEILVLDLNEERLEIARELGGIAIRSLEELSENSEASSFDVTVDAVGADITRQQCIEATGPGGRVVFSGLHETESTLPINLTVRNELQLQGSFGYTPIDFELALQWLSEGRVDLSPWVTHAPLVEGGDCFERLLTDPGKVAKILLRVS
jgi:2-desacetyl-2-hydroxyethyl bacteriochlorophyllide A dehydrogenase